MTLPHRTAPTSTRRCLYCGELATGEHPSEWGRCPVLVAGHAEQVAVVAAERARDERLSFEVRAVWREVAGMLGVTEQAGPRPHHVPAGADACACGVKSAWPTSGPVSWGDGCTGRREW